jgi:hypothetical protein
MLGVWEFRPLPSAFENTKVKIKRYNSGLWTLDDGEYDLAFSGTHAFRANDGSWQTGFPRCLYIKNGRENIICTWLSIKNNWYMNEPQHPNGNAWHHAIHWSAKDYGEYEDRNSPNEIAGQSGMDYTCKQHGCANGEHVEFNFRDPHIRAGLVRDVKTKEVFTWPINLYCIHCGINPHLSVTDF